MFFQFISYTKMNLERKNCFFLPPSWNRFTPPFIVPPFFFVCAMHTSFLFQFLVFSFFERAEYNGISIKGGMD